MAGLFSELGAALTVCLGCAGDLGNSAADFSSGNDEFRFAVVVPLGFFKGTQDSIQSDRISFGIDNITQSYNKINVIYLDGLDHFKKV